MTTKIVLRSLAGAFSAVLLVLSAVNVAAASSESVYVPPSLQPDSITALVSKMDGTQTQALVSLVDLLQKSVGQEAL